jgi:hypothetical protein
MNRTPLDALEPASLYQRAPLIKETPVSFTNVDAW